MSKMLGDYCEQIGNCREPATVKISLAEMAVRFDLPDLVEVVIEIARKRLIQGNEWLSRSSRLNIEIRRSDRAMREPQYACPQCASEMEVGIRQIYLLHKMEREVEMQGRGGGGV